MGNVVQKIDDIRKQFDHEWLLVDVVDVDEDTTTVLTGKLIAHSPNQHDLYQLAKSYEGDLMTVYSEDWPEDIAAAF